MYSLNARGTHIFAVAIDKMLHSYVVPVARVNLNVFCKRALLNAAVVFMLSQRSTVSV